MHAEVIAIGSELTSGARLDTNSQWLSRELRTAGIPVHFHSTVADELDDLVNVFRVAVDRADVVLATGGLGPTLDDLTREALARLIDAPLRLHEPSLEHIRSLFARRGSPMPERNTVQAMFPEGSVPLPNPRGTAPGIWLEIVRGPDRPPCRLAAMPGVPGEMKPMFREQVLPRLPSTGRVIRELCLKCFGAGESAIEQMLGDLTSRGRNPEVGITAHEATITLRITAEADSADECARLLQQTERTIHERLGDLVYGRDDEELEDVVVRLLQDRQATVATCEMPTAGPLGQWLTRPVGFETCFAGGLVVPRIDVLPSVLGIDAAGLSRADDPQSFAERLARRIRSVFDADFGLAVVGTASLQKPVDRDEFPADWIALSAADGTKSRSLKPAGDPSIWRSRTAKAALDLLRRHLLDQPAS